MATTKDSLKADGEEFSAGFDAAPAAPSDPGDDEVFGLDLPATEGATEGDNPTEGSPVVTETPAEKPTDAPAATPAEATPPAAEPPAETPPEPAADAMPDMTQPEKSWEGRLRKREEELRALAAELDARKAELEAAPAAGTETPAEEAKEAGTETAAAKTIDPEEAARKLAEDFGEEFVDMIRAIAGHKAESISGSRVDEIGKSLQDVIDDIKNSRARRHFKEIYRAHPDFVEVSDSDAFKAWVASLPAEKKTEAERVIAGGDSDEINDLLSAFKATNKGGEGEGGDAASAGVDEDALAAAEGVRSTGLRLPDEPQDDSDYAKSWDQF